MKEREARGTLRAGRTCESGRVVPALREVLRGTGGDVHWVEPRNQGAWTHVAPRAAQVLGRPLVYHGGREDAVPAPGVGKLYRTQQEAAIKGTYEGL